MPAEGTPFRRIRIDDDLWERFDNAVRRADPDSNRSAVLRKFTRWYVGDIDEPPQRPGQKKCRPEDGGSDQRYSVGHVGRRPAFTQVTGVAQYFILREYLD